jgi:hypothetical protein
LDFLATGQTTPVPLPASITLLLGGLAAIFWYARRTGRSNEDRGLVATSI